MLIFVKQLLLLSSIDIQHYLQQFQLLLYQLLLESFEFPVIGKLFVAFPVIKLRQPLFHICACLLLGKFITYHVLYAHVDQVVHIAVGIGAVRVAPFAVVLIQRPVAVMNTMVEYGEGIFVGYRGIDQFGHSAEYPFGYGLSYSKFEYSFNLSPKYSSLNAFSSSVILIDITIIF